MSRVLAAVRANAPDPDDALRRAERVLDAVRETGADPDQLSAEAVTILVLACQRAPYLALLLARDGSRLDRVAADPHLARAKPAEQMEAELTDLLADLSADDPDELDSRLRRYRADELVRLGARELELGNRAEVGAELAHLSDAAFDAAIRFHDAALRRRYGAPRYTDDDGTERDAALAVIGMGKLGGEELNFASDVDVIYVYSSDDGAAGNLSLHEYFCKLCERVTQSISRVTAEDLVFKVDLRLRPEGSRGAIANSLASTERYYESWGRPWERQAWLKARACAGDRALGGAMLETLRPFVYPRSVSTAALDDVADLNRRIKAELDVAGVESGFDLKNGVGGIREVEFFAQAHQLLHGGRRPTLRSRSTLVALDQLLFAGLIGEPEHKALTEAYRFLRHAEHLLQLDSGRQTQRLPDQEEELDLFARRARLAGADQLRAELARHTAAVTELFATLGDEDEGPPPEVIALLRSELDGDRELELLAELGFADPARAQVELERARRKPMSPFHHAARGIAARVAPGLLAEIATSPDPDQALHFVTDLIGRRGSWSALWGMFDQNPMLMRLIASLFGTSEFLSKTFVRHPELIDSLLQTGRASARASRQQLLARLAARMERIDPDDPEQVWSALAELKQAQVLRIGLADIGGTLDADEVSEELSILAEVVLDRALDLVTGGMRESRGVARHADGSPATLSVIAMGKLGARELGYASDLDLIFVYSGDGESDGRRPLANVTYMTRIAQRLMSGLHALHPGGRLYEIDTRLRPEGSKGLLVSSLAGWEKYHQGAAQLWERQALIKLRPVAGDPELGRRVAERAIRYAYGRAPGQDGSPTVDEIRDRVREMRDKIERELGSGDTYDLKAGAGGIIDVEFAAQYLQLVWGHDHELLRCQGTVPALRAAQQVGVLGRADADLLIDGYRFLRRVENRMRIVHDRSVHRLPAGGPELELLARRAGMASGRELARDCRRWMNALRDAYDRVTGS